MRCSEDRAFKYAIEGVELTLDLHWIEVVAARYHQILGAAYELNVSVGAVVFRNDRSGRTLAVPGRCWKAAILPNAAFEAVPTKVHLIVRFSESARSAQICDTTPSRAAITERKMRGNT